MGQEDVIAAAIGRASSLEELSTLEKNIRRKGLLSSDAELLLKARATAVGRAHLIQRCSIEPTQLTGAESRILDVIGEYWALQKRAGKPISRTISQINRRGLIDAAEESVCRNRPTLGFQNLTDAGLDDLSYEQIVVDYPDEFSDRAIWFARRTLNLSNETDKPPARQDADITLRTNEFLDWLEARVSPSTGRIDSFSNEDAASAIGMSGLQRNGRAFGNIQSRIDFACFRSGLPPLGLSATVPFARAWSSTGCEWAFPVPLMQAAARNRSWSAADFRQVRQHCSGLPGQAWIVWQDAMTANEEQVRGWAFGLADAPTESDLPGGSEWSDEELRASIGAYLEMLTLYRSREPFVKKRYYEALAQRFGRTAKAFEYRMQNISYVLSLLGRTWVAGLVPAKNVGLQTAARIEAFIAEAEGRAPSGIATFEVEVKEALAKGKAAPTGSSNPRATNATVIQYARDFAVKAWVLAQANGVCECCRQPAPFVGANGPYLEVHHIRLLAERGSDTISNAVAICPNCHRRLHYGMDAAQLIDKLYERIDRLVRE